MKNLLTKCYIIGFMLITLLLTVIIWDLTFGHIIKEYKNRKELSEIAELKARQLAAKTKSTFKKTILETEVRVKHYLGYDVLDEMKLDDHFHHIGFDFKPDKQSYCVECHTDLPHDKVKGIRAFTNMHASFIACQTCHIKSDDSIKIVAFKWYDRTNGQIVESPISDDSEPGAYSSKILPFEVIGGKIQRIDNQERIDFANEYRQNEKTLSDVQKSKAKKIIHQIVSKKPYACEDCHRKANPVLPYKDLGYSEKRMNAFIGTEIIGMINNYTKFYMPRILNPGFGSDESGQ
jgi:hypothetical protein